MIKAGGGAGLLVLRTAAGFAPGAAAADWNKAAFEGMTVAEAHKALGAGMPASSAEIVIKAPGIAEDGAVVPITAVSRLAGTESIAVLVEKGPSPLAATFDFLAGTETATIY